MRSINRVPLASFINFWGIDPWRANGIDLTGELVNQGRQQDTKNCYCMLQHPYNSKDQFSRDDLIEMLKFGEEVFIDEAGFYPTPTQILSEGHQYNYKNGLYQKTGGFLKSIEPKYNYHLKETGTRVLESLGYIVLVRDDIGDESGDILQEFSGSFPLGTITDLNKIHIYFTESDGRDISIPIIEQNYEWEIRPIRFKINSGNVEFNTPAYLFKKPELDESATCVLHEFDSYVTTVEVFYETINKCEQGGFVCEKFGCSGNDCESTLYQACFNSRKVGLGYNLVPYPKSCNANGDFIDYNLNCVPNEVRVNYISGQTPSYNFTIPTETQKAIFLLSICMYDCIKKWCVCDICPNQITDYYRAVELIKIESSPKGTSLGDRYVHYISQQTKDYIKGLPPYRGLAEAFTIISRIGKKELEGTIL